MHNTINVFGYDVYSDHLSKIDLKKEGQLLNTISPNSYGLATKDKEFRIALMNSDYLVLDGAYFALASIILERKTIKKNPGPVVFDYFMRLMNSRCGKVFFLGSSSDILEKIESKASKEFKNISVSTFSPPFKKVFSDIDNQKMIEAINNESPDILFIGMTCPKQEKWAYQHRLRLNAKLICSIGAVFDCYSGSEKSIHPIWWKFNLAWLKRTIDRPQIIKRYPDIGIFFFHLICAIFGVKKYRSGSY